MDPSTRAAEVASWLALAATYNASVVAASWGINYKVKAGAGTQITAPLLPSHRAHAERLLAGFLVEAPVLSPR